MLETAEDEAKRELTREAMYTKIAEASDALVAQLAEELEYQYPYQQQAGRKSKYSVSELKHAAMVENMTARKARLRYHSSS